MNKSFSFCVDGRPLPWKRPESRRGQRLRFTNPRVREHMDRVALEALTARPEGWPLDREYVLRIEAVRPRRNADLSNITKLVEDALNKIAWDDDRQVARLEVWRTFATPEEPMTKVRITIVPSEQFLLVV